jgi:ABC-type multidrug transport system ATPase subunit
MIVATDLCLALAGRTILDHLSFTIARGESVGLVGANGSGKTSVLRCLLGLVPFSGRAVIHGHDVVREPVTARALMSYVPQKAAFHDATAAEVLHFAAKLRGIGPHRIVETLEEVALAAHAGERVRTFSGGMLQRLSLAMGLLADARVLLLDEPSASLDRQGQELFFTIMRRLRARGATLLLASHRAEEVDSLTDRVLELEAGRFVSPAASHERGGRIIALAARGERR